MFPSEIKTIYTSELQHISHAHRAESGEQIDFSDRLDCLLSLVHQFPEFSPSPQYSANSPLKTEMIQI
jgi:hypothetical protein